MDSLRNTENNGDSDDDRVDGHWACGKNGWWLLSRRRDDPEFGRDDLEFRFAGGASPPDAGGPSNSGDEVSGDIMADEYGREVRNALAIATGLRVGDSSLLFQVLGMADDPVPQLVHLEILMGISNVASDSILMGIRAGKFAALKFIKLGGDLRAQEADTQWLSEFLRVGRFPSLSGLWVRFDSGYCSESTLDSFVTSLECIECTESLSLLSLTGGSAQKRLLKLMQSGRFRTLEELNLCDNWMRHTGCERFGEVISEGFLENLHTLNLSGNGIGNVGLEALSRALESGGCTSLRTLSLESNEVGDRGLSALAYAVESGQCSSLQKLNLSSNPFGDKGLEIFSRALESGGCSSLRTLNLGYNKFRDKGLEALSWALESGRCSSLRRLDLNYNKFGNEGLEALSRALESNGCSSLQKLNLSFNSSGNKGLEAFARALESGGSSCLRRLNLDNNKFKDEGLKALSRALESGSLNGLNYIGLIEMSTSFTETGVEALVAAFANNPVLVTEVGMRWTNYPELERRLEGLVRRNRENVQIRAAFEGKK